MNEKLIVQTVGKAALKTFIQAAVAILALLAIPELTSWAGDLQNGQTIVVDLHWWANVMIAAIGGGIAALISALYNWSKTPTQPPVVLREPTAIDG